MLPEWIWFEKKPGHGEDAEPLEVTNENIGTVLAVFDGLGGAGAAKIEQPGGEAISEARLAAIFLRKETKAYFSGLQSSNDLDHIELVLSDFLKDGLKSYNSNLPRVKSKLKSSLSKQLPSTACILIHDTTKAEPVLNALWAGDSRAYRVRTDGALECLTSDHVKHRSKLSKPDYFIGNGDAAITNCISASHDFKLHRTDDEFFAKDTIVAFVCSDGVFGAFKDHLNFEQAVLKTLIGVTSKEEFKQYIDKHRSDDVSLQTMVIQDPDQHREAIDERLKLLKRAIDEDKDPDAWLSVVNKTFPFVPSTYWREFWVSSNGNRYSNAEESGAQESTASIGATLLDDDSPNSHIDFSSAGPKFSIDQQHTDPARVRPGFSDKRPGSQATGAGSPPAGTGANPERDTAGDRSFQKDYIRGSQSGLSPNEFVVYDEAIEIIKTSVDEAFKLLNSKYPGRPLRPGYSLEEINKRIRAQNGVVQGKKKWRPKSLREKVEKSSMRLLKSSMGV